MLLAATFSSVIHTDSSAVFPLQQWLR